jgi:hypothetical protein
VFHHISAAPVPHSKKQISHHEENPYAIGMRYVALPSQSKFDMLSSNDLLGWTFDKMHACL